ncbi:hypothetical protein niasHT_010946 [Heterodera trifolii]|uniref:Uncharacterized protein n=1 Tax=Heterodera trifolii TaxID=157864 RepID=A0ABD2LGX0_9BILA
MLKGTEEENTEEISENFDEQKEGMEENEQKKIENREEKKVIGEKEENIGEKLEKEGKLEENIEKEERVGKNLEKEEKIEENLDKDKKIEKKEEKEGKLDENIEKEENVKENLEKEEKIEENEERIEEKEEKMKENLKREEKFDDREEKSNEKLEKRKLEGTVSKSKDFETENGTKLKKKDEQFATEQLEVNEFAFIKMGDFEDDQFLALKYGEFLAILSRNEDGEKARKAWSPALKQIEEKENFAKCAAIEHSLAHLLDIGILANEIWHYVQTMKALNGKSKDLAKFENKWAQLKQLKLEEEISSKILEQTLFSLLKRIVMEGIAAKNVQNLKLEMNGEIGQVRHQLHLRKFYEHFVTFVCAGTEWNVEKFCHFVGKRLGHELLYFVEQSSANLINFCHIYPKLVQLEQQLSEDKKWKNLQRRIWLVGLKLQKQKKRNDEALTSELKAVLSSKLAEIDAKIKSDFEGKRYYNVRLNSEFVERSELDKLANFR